MDKELKPFSPVYARGVRGQVLQGFCWARVRSILSAATASLLVSTLALTIAFPDAIYGALAAFTGVSKVSPVIQGNANLSPLERRLTSVMAAQRTEFLRVNSLIRVRPGADGPVLKVREEYLVGVFGNEMKHGFKRQFHLAEPQLNAEGKFQLGQRLDYRVTEASRRPLPLDAVSMWMPLLDSNEQLGFPAPRRFDTTLSETSSGVSVALGKVGEPLLPGFYVYRLDYEVHSAVVEGDSRGFVFSALQPLTLSVQEYSLQVLLDPLLVSHAQSVQLAVQSYITKNEDARPDTAPSRRVDYRERWDRKGEQTEDGSALVEFLGSALDPHAGLQLALRWK